jgi:hypothetical protein
MAEEIPTTPDGAIRAWFFAIGFTLVLVGGDMMAEKAGDRFGLGLALVLIALPVHLSWVFWSTVKSWLSIGTLKELRAIANNPRWWFASILVVLAALIFMPLISTPRMPSWPFSRTELATLRTSLRLQFNAVETKPQQIDAQNVHWSVAGYDEQLKQTPDRKYVCDPDSIASLSSPSNTLSLLSTLKTPTCSYVDFPNYHEVINTILFLTFDQSIAAKKIVLDAHGAELPKWDVDTLNDKVATVYFHGEMAHMILDVDVEN